MSDPAAGGPAFPLDWPETATARAFTEGGMSLRDWFAGLALQGQLANPSLDHATPGLDQILAEEAYKSADAMLAERAK